MAEPVSETTKADAPVLPERTREDGERKEKKDKKKEKNVPKASKEMAPKTTKPTQQKKKIEGAEMIGIDVRKEDDLAEWYQQVITKAEMIEFSNVSGCYILLPPSYSVWEYIQTWFDAEIKKLGVKNCYFPIFISEDDLQKEKDHLEGFAAEVAWVTHGGKSKLEKPVAIRPTSETAMYGYYSKKIRSHRDLPLKLNQWNNVVRWEFKHPMPFLRSREFLWQEGHTAHLTRESASEEVLQILDLYAAIYENLLAVPVVKGTKTENEKFPGADYTTTVEGFISATGRGIQGGTSHCLGQHFSKMFGITVQDPTSSEPLNVWQNSWGFTTRSIGVMVLTHSDNKGLVVPPRVAETQVAIVPVGVTAKTTTEDRDKLYKEIEAIAEILKDANVRVEVDFREGYSPGWKFNDWELKGVPLRLEFGPKDSANHVVTASRRDQDGKSTIAITELNTAIPELLETIQADLFKKADESFRTHRVQITDWKDFVPTLNAKNLCLIPHCLGGPCEDEIKEMSKRQQDGDVMAAEDAKAPSMGAKSLCIPFEQPSEIAEGTKCTNPNCKAAAQKWVMFGRSY
ncbi:prolyl-tRNA synthetase [Coniosporium apollinis CBS 100218]|uniref:proline--tRNA ligase n=1 Tax=Coniosporium apollinis (strain CBS 100218) TaxID=1168221 RepID=R7YG54_CONA1|nr:prolyl-tRNA synthetase [Coniosporium apollinis CBS 100218]EON60868.1 prolyl-tRNA synthetase [Coniosporium apollinis CBS 100218]